MPWGRSSSSSARGRCSPPELAARGVVVAEEDARRAMLAEMAYYRAHHDEADTGPR